MISAFPSSAIPALLGALTVRLPTGEGPRKVVVGLLAVARKTFGSVTLTGNAGYPFVTRDRQLEL